MGARIVTTNRRTRLATLVVVLLAAGHASAQTRIAAGQYPAQRHHPDASHVQAPPPPAFGAPLPGLTPVEIKAFAAGLDEFRNVETVRSGLGPIYNNTSCAACHSRPAIGGASNIVVTRFGRTVNGTFDPLTNLGGTLLQDKAIAAGAREVVPSTANVVAHRQTTPLFGMGLMEAIPDKAILANITRGQQQGLHGTASMVADVTTGKTRVGRFGWKAQQATLLAFAGDAYLNEMGITNRFFPTENAPNGNQARLAQYDKVADPEDVVDPKTGRSDIDALADFMRYLAPPPPTPSNPAADRGRRLFDSAGCSGCHTPVMQTGPNAIAALDRKPVHLWSDLLLHDMGSLGDGIVQNQAAGRQIRTAPLWGLRASAPWLHDGRAATIDDAIRLHDGDARRSRDAYLHLQEQQRQQILAFLDTI
ncbi:MAG TPA: di-heme oxidoredictase family protein [Xanthomonadaceae bacterium]|jgi:CxxC motif-containing protein (DUF1111 family)